MLRLSVLGPLEARAGGRQLEIGSGRQRALLVRLAVAAGEAVTSDRLVEDLWDGRPPPSAAKLVQGHVSRLRRALGADAIETLESGYLLRAGETDAAEFERLVHAAQDGGRSPKQVAEGLREALALWRGPPLSDVAYEPWAQVAIGRLEELRLVAVEELFAARLELGEAAELVPELETLVREQPLREGMCAHLMLALYRAGRQVEALDVYRSARSALVEGLGIEPTRKLRELEQAILRQDPALDARASLSVAVPESRGFIGREQELSALIAGLEDAFAGRGRLFLIQGEPGIGKSRLAEEVILRARAGGAGVLVGRCWEAGGAPAFWPWLQMLRVLLRETAHTELGNLLDITSAELAQLLPELSEHVRAHEARATLDSEAARFRLFEAVSLVLRNAARAKPVVVFLDDMHAADQPSLLLLQFLARELRDARMLVMVAYRDVDPALSGSLVEALTELVREPETHRIALAGMSEAETRSYVELVSGAEPPPAVLAAINEETEGNPFFISEIVRLLEAEGGQLKDGLPARVAIPQSVREVIRRRLRHLSRECNDLLTCASVLGREFGTDALAGLAQLPADRINSLLEEAAAERVVTEARGRAGRFAFAHLLIRETLYDGLSGTRRGALHRQAGEALEAVFGDNPDPHAAELAHHFLAAAAAGGADKALFYAGLAGDQAAGVLAFEEAVRLYDAALDVAHDDGVRASLLERRARIVQLQGRLREARAALEAAVSLYRARGDRLAAGRVLTALANVLWRSGDAQHKDEPVTEAIALLEAEPPSPELVTAYSELAGHRAMEAANAEAIAAADRALDLAHTLSLPVPARALGYRGEARAALGERQGLDDMRRALELATDEHQERAAAVIHNNRALAIWLYDGPGAALVACRDGIEYCLRRGIAEWADYIASTAMLLLAWSGRPDEALAQAGPLGERAEASADIPILIEVRAVQLRLAAERGESRELATASDELAEIARQSGEPYHIAVGLSDAANALVTLGETERAKLLLHELERLPTLHDDIRFVAGLPGVVRGALDTGDHDLAHRLAVGVLPRMPLFEHALCSARALLAEASDEPSNAASLYAEAADRWLAFENLPERAYALLGRGRCLRATYTDGANTPLEAAAVIFRSLGYSRALAEAEHLIAS